MITIYNIVTIMVTRFNSLFVFNFDKIFVRTGKCCIVAEKKVQFESKCPKIVECNQAKPGFNNNGPDWPV